MEELTVEIETFVAVPLDVKPGFVAAGPARPAAPPRAGFNSSRSFSSAEQCNNGGSIFASRRSSSYRRVLSKSGLGLLNKERAFSRPSGRGQTNPASRATLAPPFVE